MINLLLSQRWNFLYWLTILGQVPICQQLPLVLGGPFNNKPQSSRRNLPRKYPQGAYLNCHVILPIPCMEMGWIVIIEKHSYDDSIKPTNLWHIYTYFTLNAVRFHPATAWAARGRAV